MARIIRCENPTNKSVAKTFDNLVEEYGDVLNYCEVIGIQMPYRRYEKINRWKDRLEESEKERTDYMFDKVTRKIVKKAVDTTKETVKEEATASMNDILPKALPVIGLGIMALVFLDPFKPSPRTVTYITNNYYYYGGMRR